MPQLAHADTISFPLPVPPQFEYVYDVADPVASSSANALSRAPTSSGTSAPAELCWRTRAFVECANAITWKIVHADFQAAPILTDRADQKK
mmetsp:Transcript_123861/g.332642  ORF Transcript_123861/g.332642 Transcript_123861/m.332642 type:complete len:91 (-) Transcript_123861:105-377(-)